MLKHIASANIAYSDRFSYVSNDSQQPGKIIYGDADLPMECHEMIRIFKHFKEKENEGLLWAIEKGDISLVQIFIIKGAQNFGQAIKQAIIKEHTQIFYLLFSKCHLLHYSLVSGGLLTLADKYNNEEIVRFLMEKEIYSPVALNYAENREQEKKIHNVLAGIRKLKIYAMNYNLLTTGKWENILEN